MLFRFNLSKKNKSPLISPEQLDLNNRLLQAVKDGDLRTVKSCMQAGADPHQALFVAALHQNNDIKFDLLYLLITQSKIKLNLDCLDANNRTTLMHAVSMVSRSNIEQPLKIIEFLLENGANPKLKAKNQITANSIARFRVLPEINQIIQQFKINRVKPKHLDKDAQQQTRNLFKARVHYIYGDKAKQTNNHLGKLPTEILQLIGEYLYPQFRFQENFSQGINACLKIK